MESKQNPQTIKSILFYLLLVAIVMYVFTAKNEAGISIGGYRALIVLTSSMEPEIQSGSLAIIAPADSHLEIGDIITFKAGSSYLTHRIVKGTGQGEYATRGDANQEMDSNAVNDDEIVGKYWFSIPYLGQALVMIATPLGFLLSIISLIILYLCYKWFLYYICKRKIHQHRKLEEKNEEE